MKRSISATAMLLLSAATWAQVSLYEFAQSVQPYVPITEEDGGVSLGSPTWSSPFYNNRCWVNNPFNDPGGNYTNGYLGAATGPGYPIGFDYTFNGDVFDRVGISGSGFITFGKSSDALNAVWVYDITHPHGRPFVQSIGGPTVPYKRNRVAAWGNAALYMRDMSPMVPPGPITSLRIATIGAAPNRVCVIQFQDFLGAYPPSDSRINFQIRLNEVDNSVEVRYGRILFNYMESSVQVGLGGRSPEDFNSRRTVSVQPSFLHDWNITEAGELNTDACTAAPQQLGNPAGSGIPPVVGLTFKWSPPVCPPPAWPLAVTDVGYAWATAQWGATSAGEYEYFVSTENSIDGPEVASGITTDPEAVIEELEAGTTYYVFVRSICAGEEGTWSAATEFATLRGGMVLCDGGVVNEDYCSQQHNVQEWLYLSADGSPLRIEFEQGTVGSNAFHIWVDGASPSGPATRTLSGEIGGQFVQAAAGQIFMRLVTDAGACEAQDFYHPLQWRIGCKNCSDPLVNYSLGTVSCAEQEYYVSVDIFSMGSSTTLLVENSLGLPSTTLSATGIHEVGPFPAGAPVSLLARNPENAMCYFQGAEIVNEPCAIEDCGPTWYEYCATQSAVREWLLQGEGEAVAVRFPPVYMGWDADVYVYDGADVMAPATRIAGSTTNNIVVSTNPQHMLLVRYEASVYRDYACSLGATEPLRFVVECADGCTAPIATFSYAECSVPESYNIVVNVTDLGAVTGLTISNNAGLAATPVNATGSYTVGPFPSATPVNLLLAGTSEVCQLASPTMNKDCLPMSVLAHEQGDLHLYPNPGAGLFRVELPATMSGRTELQVLDLSGRVVANEVVNALFITLDLQHLPNGLYTLVARNASAQATARIAVQH